MSRRFGLVMLVCAVITGCSHGPDQASLPRIAKEAGIQFPESSQLVYQAESPADKSGVWIIRSPEQRFELPGDKETTDSESVRLDLDRLLKRDVVGVLEDGIASSHGWHHTDLRYRGIIIRSSAGYFLRLERFAQP